MWVRTRKSSPRKKMHSPEPGRPEFAPPKDGRAQITPTRRTLCFCPRLPSTQFPPLSVVLFVMLGFGTELPMASAMAQPANSETTAPSLDARITKIVEDAEMAFSRGNASVALIHLKNAVRLAPTNGEVRARLGLLLLRVGELQAAERELRQSRIDKAPEELAVPGLLQAMLARNELQDLLAEFPEPARTTQDKIAADVARARAIAFQLLGRTKEANAAGDRALDLRRDAPALITRAKLARAQNDAALARRLTDEAIRLAPGNDEAMTMRISLLRQDGETEKALTLVDEFAKRDPRNTLPKVLRVEILFELKRDGEAQTEIDAILKQNANSTLGTYYNAMLRMRANDFQGAWQIAQTLPPQFVQSQPETAMTIARMATASGNLETGAAILASLVSTRQEAVEARLQLAAIRLSQKLPDAALATLAPLENSNTPLVEALFAQAYLQLRRFNEAIASLESALSLAGDNDLLKQQLVMSRLQIGDTDQGIQELREILARRPADIETSALLVGALIRTGKLDEAIRVVDGLVKTGVSGPLPAFFRGQVLRAQGQFAGAVTAFGEAFAADPQFIPALYYRANASLARGDREEATKDLQQVLSRDPRHILAYVRLAQIALETDQEPRALEVLTQGIRTVPTSAVLRLALANYQASSKNFSAAQTTLNDLLIISRNNPEGLALLGQIQILRGEQRDGIDTLRKLAAENPQSPAVYILLAKALNTTKDFLAAEDAAKTAVQLAPNSAQIRSLLVELQAAHGKANDALDTARNYGSQYPGPAADGLLADTFFRLKRTNEAVSLLTKSLNANPDRSLALRLSRITMSLGDTAKSIGVLESWLEKYPADFEVRREYGSVLIAAGNTARARQEFEALLKLHPEDPAILNNLGWILQKDDPARALSLLSLAVKRAPRSAEITDTLGWIKFQQKDYQAALTLLQRAHDLDENSAMISYHLAVALDAGGKRAEAKSLLQSTLATNPKFGDIEIAKQLLERW